MKKIFYLTVILSMMSMLSAQHKTLTLYYPDDSTNVISIANLDSMSVFICGASKVIYSGKAYNTVLIGNQCWLKENLDIGTRIDGNQNQTNNGIFEKYCYGNNSANCATYGGFYQWDEAMQYSRTPGTQGICPPGWHIPTLAEFQSLSSAVGGDGNALKAVGQGSGGGAGTNTSGLSVLIAGYRHPNSLFLNLGYSTHCWSSTEYNADNAYYLGLIYNGSNIFLEYPHKEHGLSVRCIKD